MIVSVFEWCFRGYFCPDTQHFRPQCCWPGHVAALHFDYDALHSKAAPPFFARLHVTKVSEHLYRQNGTSHIRILNENGFTLLFIFLERCVGTVNFPTAIVDDMLDDRTPYANTVHMEAVGIRWICHNFNRQGPRQGRVDI